MYVDEYYVFSIVDQTALGEEILDRRGWGCQHAAILSGKDPKVVCDYVRSELPGNILFLLP